MAKSITDTEAAKAKYGPTELALNRPRTVNVPHIDNPKLKIRVALGGSVTIKRKPPKLDSTVPEANAEQYKYCYEVAKLFTLVVKE